jgi:Asp-tRNA(Asn)/Glu-tRNA(Gln) amidotransferase A subunit family amidase
MADRDPARLTATQARAAIAAGRLTAVELVEACLARTAAREPRVQAFVHLDAEQARAAARAADAAGCAGLLGGIPVAVKDVIDTHDMPTQMNSPIWFGWQPRGDAACVAWTRAEGGVVMGKTMTTEFASRHPGPTANPRGPLDPARARTPGGSSSGSAAAVADGMAPLAFGTQTAGSIIRPAAYCGIVGFKPTYGTISRVGMKIMSDSLDTIGVLARSVADCALFAGALSGRDLGDPDRTADRAPRIGICRGPTWPAAQPETAVLLDQVAVALSRAGASVVPRELPAPFAALVEAHPLVMYIESARALGSELTRHRAQVSTGLLQRLDPALAEPPARLDWARGVFASCQAAFPAAVEGLDVLVTPAAPGEAPEGLGWTGDPAFNFVWTALHVPCVTVPAGVGPNGMPLGIQVVAPRGQDAQALAWARWVQAAVS